VRSAITTSSPENVSTHRPIRYTTVFTTQFERVSETIAERVTELLCAHVSVVDEQEVVVASSAPGMVGRQFEQDEYADEQSYLRIPLRLEGQAGAVIVGEPLNGEAISPRLKQVLVRLVISQAAVVDHSPHQHERKNTFIHELLHGRIDDEEAILREASILGMDFATPRAVILINAANYIMGADQAGRPELSDTMVRRRAQLVIGSVVSFFHLPNDTICAYLGDGEVAVLKACNTRNLATWADRTEASDQGMSSWANLAALKRAGEALHAHLQADTHASISVGIGRYHPGVCAIARSYEDARAALSLGRRFHGQNQAHCLDGLGTAAFVGIPDERTKVELAAHLLSPLDHEPELIETLAVFFATNCCPSATASQLSIHRNTLTYRLQKIASLTGLDPRRFDEATQIHLALLLRSLHS
jgi:carbohydrate diacid regulator